MKNLIFIATVEYNAKHFNSFSLCLRHFQDIVLSFLLKYKILFYIGFIFIFIKKFVKYFKKNNFFYQLLQLRNSELEIILKFKVLNKYIPANVEITWAFLLPMIFFFYYSSILSNVLHLSSVI